MDLAARLAHGVAGLTRADPRVLVGIDGPDCAGKTTLADRLADALELPSVRVSIDGFHQPREVRYRRGELSAAGYYLDSFDYQTLLGRCLVPFLGGASRLVVCSYDHRADRRVARCAELPARAVLVFDGVFLLRTALRPLWTLSVYLRVSPAQTLRRALLRDRDLFGSAQELTRRYRLRYLPAQQLYHTDAQPEAAADVVVDNERFDAPTVVRWTVPGAAPGTADRPSTIDR